MKKSKKYILYDKNICSIIGLNTSLISGYYIKPKNGIRYDGIAVKSMTILNYDLTQTLLRKKIKKKLDVYLQFLINVLDEDDTDPGHLMFALDDLDRYRHIVINNYKAYLDKKYLKILMDKIDLIDQELRSKINYGIKTIFPEQIEFDLSEPKKGKSR